MSFLHFSRLYTVIRIIFTFTSSIRRHFHSNHYYVYLLCFTSFLLCFFLLFAFIFHICVCTRLFESFLRLPALFHVISLHFYGFYLLCVFISNLRYSNHSYVHCISTVFFSAYLFQICGILTSTWLFHCISTFFSSSLCSYFISAFFKSFLRLPRHLYPF